jgi:hypothetical protein
MKRGYFFEISMMNCKFKWLSLVLSLFLIFSLTVSLAPQTVLAGSASPYQTITTDASGRQMTMADFPLLPPDVKMAVADVPEAHIAGATNSLTDVPAFDWSYGCSATSAAMLFGYYDRTGYSNMYAGPTDGGVCPLNNSVWGHTVYSKVTCGECPINATHNGKDSRITKGHVDDYWIDANNAGPDPWVDNWTQHTPDCAGDYMGTNQSYYHNIDGSTRFYWFGSGDPLPDYIPEDTTYRDGCHGLKLFAESRGYTVVTNFTQLIQGQGTDPGKGFTFANFQSEIDAGRPVLIQLDGHSMLGYGYNTTGNIVYIHDTWDYSSHSMTWGSTYSGMQHLAVTVIRLQSLVPPPAKPTLVSPAAYATVSSLTPELVWNSASGAVTYELQISKRSSFSTLLFVQSDIATTTFTVPETTLAWSGTYYWRVRAVNSGGVSSWSSYRYFKTPAELPPAAPSDLSATAFSSSQIDLSWSDNSANETGFELERKTGEAGTFSLIASPGANVTIYSDTGLSPATTYFYRVRALSGIGNSDYSSESSTATFPLPPAKPTLVSPAAYATVSSLTPELVWNSASGAVTYELQISKRSSFSTLLFVQSDIATTTFTVPETTLAWSGTYYWRVRAVNSGGVSSWSSYRYFKTPAELP